MERIEVYKTNVNRHSVAETIVAAILRKLPNYKPSFDLEDCDNVLRVESLNGKVDESKIRNILNNYGYQIERLP